MLPSFPSETSFAGHDLHSYSQPPILLDFAFTYCPHAHSSSQELGAVGEGAAVGAIVGVAVGVFVVVAVGACIGVAVRAFIGVAVGALFGRRAGALGGMLNSGIRGTFSGTVCGAVFGAVSEAEAGAGGCALVSDGPARRAISRVSKNGLSQL